MFLFCFAQKAFLFHRKGGCNIEGEMIRTQEQQHYLTVQTEEAPCNGSKPHVGCLTVSTVVRTGLGHGFFF